MEQPPEDPLLVMLVVAVFFASVATWFALLARWRRGEPFLDYEPRRPVPWGAPFAMLAVAFVAIALLSPQGVDAATPPEGPNPLEISQRLVGFIALQCVVIGCVLVLVAVIYRPTLRDLGLPVYADELVRDVRIGIVACLAAIAPVYGVQRLMLYVFGPSEHPLVKMVTGGEPNVGLLFLASIAAVVIAPVSEEVFFRLLLQGWLEKWEDRRSRWHGEPLPALVASDALPELPADGENDEARMTNDEEQAVSDSSFVIRHSSFPDPPPRGLVGLPHGWQPILISSLLFALAHFGYGPDPIAIFFLALILGYVYQRTHRIVPCMVAHALFNSLAMLILWRGVFVNLE